MMQIFQYFLTDGVVEVSFHELENKVEVFIVVCLDDVVQPNDVGVVHVVEVADLSVGSLCVD